LRVKFNANSTGYHNYKYQYLAQNLSKPRDDFFQENETDQAETPRTKKKLPISDFFLIMAT